MSQSTVAQALSMVKSKVGSPLAKCKTKMPKVLARKQRCPKQPPEPTGALCGASGDVDAPLADSVGPPTFEENLEGRSFSEASRQLIGREEHLFKAGQPEQEEEEAELKRDGEALMEEVWQTVRRSLHPLDQSEQSALWEAVLAIQQEEEQDRKWEESGEQRRPEWRPRRCRHAHDCLLEEMVRERMQEAEPYPGAGLSSVESELIGLGRRIKQDLLQVARQVRGCYPGNVGVCQIYARLYHSAFSARLTALADFGLGQQDCTHLLSWTNQHYPSILQEPELVCEVNIKLLDPLLPADMLRSLEEQFLEHREAELQKCLQNTIMREEQDWRGGVTPKMIDSCYFSTLAIDVIQCVDSNLKSCCSVLGENNTHTHRLTERLTHFFHSYQDFLEKVMKQNGTHSRPVVMANLHGLHLFRKFITEDVPLSKDARSRCVTLVTSMTESCHTHLTCVIHQSLKETYRKLWTHNWLQNRVRVCEQLCTTLNTHLQDLRAMEHTSRQEVLGVLHEEVLVEYVRRMMKRKMKLKDKHQQEEAAIAVCADNTHIHTLFTEAGSTVDWLGEVLPELAELLRIQDHDTIQLQLLTLTSKLPDISVGHVSALLQMKSGLSERECKMIKKTFSEITHTDHTLTHTSARLFFSKVKLS